MGEWDLIEAYERPKPAMGVAPASAASEWDLIDTYQLKKKPAPEPPPVKTPGMLDSAVAGARRAASFGFGDEIEAAALRARDAVTGRQGPGYTGYRDQIRARDKTITDANPWSAAGGEFVGGVATSLIPGIAPARAATVGQVALQGAKVGAIYGAGNSEADLTKGDVPGLARDIGISAGANALLSGGVAKFVRGAPERVDDRIIKNISRGEAGGAAKDSLYKKVVKAAGDEGDDLLEATARDPKLGKVLATRAASNPGSAQKFVEGKLAKLTPQTEPIYKAIDAAPNPRVIGSTKPFGGVDVGILDSRLASARDRLIAEGKTGQAAAYDRVRANLAQSYGEVMEDGTKKLIPGTALPARSVRNFANEVGEIAFAGDASMSPGFKAKAQRAIYREVTGAIEDAGQAAGVNVSRLKELNKEISMLIPIRDALADRAAKAAAGRTSAKNLLQTSLLPLAGFSGGGLEGMAAGAAVAGGIKAGLPIARSVDYQMAQLVKAARGGSTPAQLGQAAIELGMSRAAAEQISRRGIGALQPDAPAAPASTSQEDLARQAIADPNATPREKARALQILNGR